MRQFVGWALLFLASGTTVSANEYFQTKVLATYKFDAVGKSTVTQRIKLTNTTTEKYARQFMLSLGDTRIVNITGSDALGPLQILATGSAITVNFNSPMVGKKQTQEFVLSYSGPDAKHTGQIWEINVPSAPDPSIVDDYELHLQIDPALGHLAFVAPQPRSITNRTYIFTRDQLDEVGVVAAFGNFQTFAFNLKYQLVNSQNRPVYFEIALPADTNYQRVFYDDLQPRPAQVSIDEDGNWLARYDLQAAEKLQITAWGQVHVLAEPNRLLAEPETATQLAKYLQPTHYWPRLETRLKTPQEIYNYVVSTLDYDFSHSDHIRLGAAGALANPGNSVCTEFTDLFIALARSAGIPAREVNGFAYTADSTSRPLSLARDVLHAWPQYWDPASQLWINVDPTWENTTGGVDYFHKLDFNHFAFVTHGVSDVEPLAAGFYKTNEQQKDVQVDFAIFKDYPLSDFTMNWQKPWQIFPITNSASNLILSNASGQAQYNVNIHLTPQNFQLGSPENFMFTEVPPYGQVHIPIVITKGHFLNFRPQTLIIRTPTQSMTYNIPASLYLLWNFCVGLIFSALLIGLAFVAGRTRSVYFQKSKSGYPVHR